MKTLAERTARKYRGRKAATYDAVRTKQRRWHLENEAVAEMTAHLKPGDLVLDCPVGTGRYLKLWSERGLRVRGIDASEEMIAIARRKLARIKNARTTDLAVGDAANTGMSDDSCSAAVCVRFLDLIDEKAMRAVVKEMTRVARHTIVLTIRLGDAYVEKSNTATHDRRKFFSLVRTCGWQVAADAPVFDAGWHVLRLAPLRP